MTHGTTSLLLLALTALLTFGSCQSPVKTTEDLPVTVTVVVRDQRAQPMASIPVELHRGAAPSEQTLVESRVTGAGGTASFTVALPSSGGVFSIVAGNQETGKVIRTANLLCRDTTLFISLQGKTLDCNGAMTDTVLFVDACAKSNGIDFPDVRDVRYTSQCDEPMTVTYTPLALPELRLTAAVFDSDGREVRGNSFTLPARGSFSVRFVYTPQAAGALIQSMQFSATGLVSAWTLDIAVLGNAVNCSDCSCIDGVVYINLGEVVSGGDSASMTQEEVNLNRTTCPRLDELIRNFPSGSPFKLENTVQRSIQPGKGQVVRISFTPQGAGVFTDSLVFTTVYPGNGVSCRFTVVVTGSSVQPQCCVDIAASEHLLVDQSVTPPVYTIEIRTSVLTEGSGRICYYNCGTGGWLTVSRPAVTTARGFTIPEQRYSLRTRASGGETACFDASFLPTEQMVWPNGRNSGQAVTVFTTSFTVFGCQPATVNVRAIVDTTPALFSTCIFRWDQNRFNGYNFTPAELRGSFVEDLNAGDQAAPMITDIAFLSGPGNTLTGRVRIRSGWKLVRTGVSSQADFTYEQIRTWAEFPSLSQGLSTGTPVFVIRVERNGRQSYALVRIREISDDGQKQKICMDVLYPL